MQIPNFPFVVLDTETTGFIPKTNRIIEFASMRAEEGKIIDTYEQLLSIESEIPAEVQVLTRIKPESLEGQPIFEDKKEEIEGRIGKDTLIIGQNIPFDIGMLKGEGIDLSDRAWIDTSMLASLVFPEFESYSLGYMSTVLNLNHEPVHRALGDVRATLELFSACWERLLEVPADKLEQIQSLFGKSTEGYRILAEALPKATASTNPQWLRMPTPEPKSSGATQSLALPKPDVGTVELIEEPAEADILERIIAAATKDNSHTHWIGVKNLEATVRKLAVPKGARVLYPPFLILNPEAKNELLEKDVLSADEATLAVKLAWYNPVTQSDIPIHGAEPAVWSAKLACTDDNLAYTKQFENLPSVILLDHRQLLSFLADPSHTAHGALEDGSHILIDDASMLEDTATKAYGWYCSIDTLRAAAEGHDALTTFTDLLTIWVERTRNFTDIRYLTVPDLNNPDSKNLREQALDLLADDTVAPSIKRHLSHVQSILDSEHLSGRISYVELQYNGRLVLHSVPERIGTFLQDHVYNLHSVSLLLPPLSNDRLQEILPIGTSTSIRNDLWDGYTPHFSIHFPEELDQESILSDPPAGKTIVLASSKRSIDDAYVKYAEALEEQGVTLICQGFSGGIGRTRAEFLASDEPVVWLLTSWAYEGVDLPIGSVDTLCITGMPFDHPSHAVFSKRAEHYRDPFSEYSLPRMLHRVFRLLRNYSGQCKKDATILVLDNRVRTKRYGKEVLRYLNNFSSSL